MKYNKPLFSFIKIDEMDIIQTSTLENEGAGSDPGALEMGTPSNGKAKSIEEIANKN